MRGRCKGLSQQPDVKAYATIRLPSASRGTCRAAEFRSRQPRAADAAQAMVPGYLATAAPCGHHGVAVAAARPDARADRARRPSQRRISIGSDGPAAPGSGSGASRIDTKVGPLYLSTRGYDFSRTPDKMKRTAAAIGGTSVVIRQQLGHFPISENPGQFRRYIAPVLTDILRQSIVSQRGVHA